MVLFAVVILALAGFIARTIIGTKVPAASTAKSSDDQPLEEASADQLRRLLAEALAQKDYKMVIRLYYIIILKTLDQQGAILWKKEKTNREYARELAEQAYHPDFMQLTRVYETVWYGDKKFENHDLQHSSQSFHQFLTQLNPSFSYEKK
ncbi:MAG: DUF4129 domain-containing protein [Bacteroidia bacterium]|nr:DUF4129 domain-containing protein [Bacteroidia bacterium]